MTLGTDLAPSDPKARGYFLGLFKVPFFFFLFFFSFFFSLIFLFSSLSSFETRPVQSCLCVCFEGGARLRVLRLMLPSGPGALRAVALTGDQRLGGARWCPPRRVSALLVVKARSRACAFFLSFLFFSFLFFPYDGSWFLLIIIIL